VMRVVMLALLVPFAWTQWALGTDSTCFAYRFRLGIRGALIIRGMGNEPNRLMGGSPLLKGLGVRGYTISQDRLSF
jgi:hypothetical protein